MGLFVAKEFITATNQQLGEGVLRDGYQGKIVAVGQLWQAQSKC